MGGMTITETGAHEQLAIMRDTPRVRHSLAHIGPEGLLALLQRCHFHDSRTSECLSGLSTSADY